tara:strand:+ start:1357 stop:1533 length:177 start_codon:yes stop_codon:yes gene_type:complete
MTKTDNKRYRIYVPDLDITEDDYYSFQNNVLSLTQIIDKYDVPCYIVGEDDFIDLTGG